MCPDSLQMPLEWDQVLYYTNPVTGKTSYDRCTSPIPLPHPELQFKGYVVDAANQTIAAFFAKEGAKAQKGMRLPRPAGGANRAYFEGQRAAGSGRLGLKDPEI